jgi:hypothetical protein
MTDTKVRAEFNDITKIKEVQEKDGDWEEWPYPSRTITSRISGDLKAAILKSHSLTDAGNDVTLEEEYESGGYSEYTQEEDFTLRLYVNGSEIWSHEYASSSDSAMRAFLVEYHL